MTEEESGILLVRHEVTERLPDEDAPWQIQIDFLREAFVNVRGQVELKPDRVHVIATRGKRISALERLQFDCLHPTLQDAITALRLHEFDEMRFPGLTAAVREFIRLQDERAADVDSWLEDAEDDRMEHWLTENA